MNYLDSKLIVCGLLIAGSFAFSRAETLGELPYEEKFSDFHKGSWRIEDRFGGWDSGQINVAPFDSVEVSFDVNQKGSPRSTEVTENYLRVWYELDGSPGLEPLFFASGKFSGTAARREIAIEGHRTLRILIEGESEGIPVKYYVDNLRIEAPGRGVIVPQARYGPDQPSAPLPPPSQSSGIVRYPRLPGHQDSETYSLVANGVEIPVEQSWRGLVVDAKAVDYTVAVARFSAEISEGTPLEISVGCNENIDTYSISPKNSKEFKLGGEDMHFDHEVRANRLVFKLSRPQTLMVKVNDLEYLFLLIDAPEADPIDRFAEGIVDLSDYLDTARDPFGDVTNLVQRAIDESARADKILFVPNGRYMTGQLVFPSGSQMYLQAGALLQAIPEWNRELWPAQAGANDTNRDSSFIYIGHPTDYASLRVHNVRIFGRGVIDGNGWNMRYANDSSLLTANVKLFRSANASELVVEDVYFRDSARWSFNILLSEDVRFTNVKLINCMVGHLGDWANNHKFPPKTADPLLFHIPVVTNLDAYDIDASTNVIVEDSFVFTGDDAFTPKVTGYMGLVAPCRNLVMRRNVIWTEKAALKVGPEAQDDIENILFIDNHVIRADRFFSARIDGKPGVALRNLLVKDNKAEEISGNFYQRLFRFHIAHEGSIANVLVDGLDTLEAASQHSTSEGFSEGNDIRPVTIRNLRLLGESMKRCEVFGEGESQPFSLIEFEDSATEKVGTLESVP